MSRVSLWDTPNQVLLKDVENSSVECVEETDRRFVVFVWQSMIRNNDIIDITSSDCMYFRAAATHLLFCNN